MTFIVAYFFYIYIFSRPIHIKHHWGFFVFLFVEGCVHQRPTKVLSENEMPTLWEWSRRPDTDWALRVWEPLVVGRTAEGETPEATLEVVARLLQWTVVASSFAFINICKQQEDVLTCMHALIHTWSCKAIRLGSKEKLFFKLTTQAPRTLTWSFQWLSAVWQWDADWGLTHLCRCVH